MLIGRNLLGLLLMGTQGPMLDAVMIILFIRLWTGSTLERFTSGLWQKSYDLHWHLMNDISAYVLYQITQNANLNELILLRYCSYQTKSKVYHSLYGIPYSSSSYLSKDEDYILPVSDCLLPKLNYLHKRFYKFFIILKTLIIFLELRGLSNFFHKPYSSIDAMKLSKLSTRTTPAS